MNYIVKIFIFNILILFFFACKGNQSKLEYAFESAGENRKELEKVLEHYKDDSLKLKAAIFLIENMPYYFSYEGEGIEALKRLKEKEVKKAYGTRNYPTAELSAGNLKKEYDAKSIMADYLIENIDLAFMAWEQRPWSKYISFDDFCEWVLPYRIKNEPLERWRKVYYEKYAPVLDSIYQGTDIIEAAYKMREYLNNEGFEFDNFHTICLGALFSLNTRLGSCVEYSDLNTYVMRALGFPVTTDFLLISPTHRGAHTWNVLRDTTQQDIAFLYSGTKPTREPINRKLGKVYRNCFQITDEKVPGMYQNPDVPGTLQNPFIKDVTERYFGTNKTTIDISRNKEKYVYLGMFSQSKWIPVDIAVSQNGKATFENLDLFVIYQPLFYSKREKATPAGYPFMYDGKKIYDLIPDTTHKIRMKLKRKFMMREEIIYYLQCMNGVKIEASNDKNFKNATLLYEVKGAMQDNYNILCPESKNKFRYVRYSAPIRIPAYLAELSFYRDSLAKDKLSASIYDSNHNQLNSEREINNLFDYNPLTYYTLNDNQKQLIFDFGKPEHIASIFLVPRNDDNFVWPGNSYELFYNDGAKGWISMGKQTATGNRLYYDNVPSKALYVLRNLTKGKEELVFCYANNQQYFPPGDNRADWLEEYDNGNETK